MNDRLSAIKRALLSPTLVWSVALAGLIAGLWGLIPLRESELYWHLTMGRLIAQFGAVPAANHLVYAVPADTAAYALPWLAQRLLFEVHRLGDLEALLWLRDHLIAAAALIGALGATLTLRQLHLKRAAPYGAALALIGAAIAAPVADIAPQLLAAPLWALTLGALLLRAHTTHRALRALSLMVPALTTALWANLDVAFVLPALAALWGGARAWGAGDKESARAWGLAAIGALLAALLNPRGALIYPHMLETIQVSLDHHALPAWHGVWRWSATTAASSLIGSAIALTLAARSAHRRADVTMLVILIGLALTHQRALLWLGVASPLVCAAGLGAWLTHQPGAALGVPTGKPALRALALFLAATLPILSQPVLLTHAPLARALSPLPLRGRPPHAATLPPEVPVEHVALIKRGVTASGAQPVYADARWSGYLLWELGDAREPRQLVFSDPRVAMLTPAHWEAQRLIETSDAWRGLFQQYGVRSVVLDRERQLELIVRMKDHPDWRLVHEDAHHSTLTRLR